MADITDRVMALHDALIYAYDHDSDDNEERDAYIDTLKQYTSAVALAASQSFAELLGIEDSVSMLELTEEQYAKLEASGMLATYIDGKDRTDD